MATSDRSEIQVVRVADENTQKALEDARDKFRGAQQQSFAGTDIEVTFPATTAKTIAHKLGRKVRGFLVVDAELSAPELYRVGGDAANVVIMHAGAASTRVRLRFF